MLLVVHHLVRFDFREFQANLSYCEVLLMFLVGDADFVELIVFVLIKLWVHHVSHEVLLFLLHSLQFVRLILNPRRDLARQRQQALRGKVYVLVLNFAQQIHLIQRSLREHATMSRLVAGRRHDVARADRFRHGVVLFDLDLIALLAAILVAPSVYFGIGLDMFWLLWLLVVDVLYDIIVVIVISCADIL